jgi:hypothetical protein
VLAANFNDIDDFSAVARDRRETDPLFNSSQGMAMLRQIRDRSAVSTRVSSKGALLKETFTVFSSVRTGLPLANVRQAILDAEVLQKTAFHTRRTIWNALKHRYLGVGSDWIGMSLAASTKEGTQSPEYLSLAYLYFALRDRLIFDFVTGPIWDRWHRQATSVDRADYLIFLDQQAETYPEIKKWHESTLKKLAGNTFSSLRDFGLLKGTKIKHIRRVTVAPETVFHLLAILTAEGLEGKAVLEAPDWRLFLWSEAEISNALKELAQMNWVRFERGGRTVILQLIRVPEVSYGQ